MDNSLLVTIIACALIIGVFFYFICQAYKQYRCRKKVDEINASNDILKALESTLFKAIREAYVNTINIDTERGVKTNIPASEYFTELLASKAFNWNYKMLDAASGNLVGLGLLGTFLGLSLGIMNFDSSSTDHIQSSIQSLLSGMATAFLTSLLGMTLSLVYNTFEKRWRNKLSRSLFILSEKLDAIYYIDDISLMTLKQQHLVDGILESLENKLSFTNEKGEKVQMVNAVREMLKENQQQTVALKSFSTDLALELSDSFGNAVSNQMHNQLEPLMEKVDNLTNHIDAFAEKVSTPATEMIQSIIEDLKDSLQSIMQEFQKSISSNTTNELDALSKSLGNATVVISGFPDKMNLVSSNLSDMMTEMKTTMSSMSKTTEDNSRLVSENLTSDVNGLMSSLRETVSSMSENMNSSMSRLTETLSTNVLGMMTEVSATLKDTVSTVSDNVKHSMSGLSDDLSTNFTGMMTEMNSAMSNMSRTTENNTRLVSENLNNDMNSLMASLKTTVETISENVRKSMSGLTDDLVQRQNGLMSLQDGTIKQTEKLLQVFNVGLDKLSGLNSNIASTMDAFATVQTELSVSASNFRNASSSVSTATESLTKGQSEYITSVKEWQAKESTTMENLMSISLKSTEYLRDYATKFALIQEGMTEIFNQLQTGLKEYSTTVRISTQSYLDSYSSHLTKTVDQLAGAINQQNELVEMLSESINAKKRS